MSVGTTPKLRIDEQRLVDYLASRSIMSFREAQELRAAIAAAYDFEDIRLEHFGRELLRRAGLSKPAPPADSTEAPKLTDRQRELLRRAVAYLSPGLDLGSERPAPIPSAKPRCPCTSAAGKSKKIFFTRTEADRHANEFNSTQSEDQEAYQCPVQTKWWHLRTVKPIQPNAEVTRKPASSASNSIADPPKSIPQWARQLMPDSPESLAPPPRLQNVSPRVSDTSTPDDAPDTTNLVVFGISSADPLLIDNLRIRIAKIRGVGKSSPWVYFTTLAVLVNLDSMVAFPRVVRETERLCVNTQQGETSLSLLEVRWY